MAEKQTYPMISEKYWWELRNQFKKTIPSTVNVSYVKILFGLKSDASAKNNVILPLKQIGLIDEDGKPTSLATDWRSDEKYSDACQTMLQTLYPQALFELFPDEEVDQSRVRSWLMDTTGIGQNTAQKATKTFLLIKSRKIIQPQLNNKGVAKKPKKRKSQAQDGNAANSETLGNKPIKPFVEPAGPSPSIHIDIQVHISPEASPNQIDKIFESMAKHLYGRK